VEEDSRNSKAEALYERHHREVHQYILRVFGFERSVVDDLTLEVFVRLWQSPRLDSGPVPRGYVYVVARNTCFQYRRNSGRKKRDSEITVSIEDLSISNGIAANGPAVEDAFTLGELLQRLPEQEKEVISLVDGPSGLTIEEAAVIMHVSRRSARHLRDKGLRKLEKWGEQLGRFGGQEQHAD
jgi:RNA polymerase sigma factor (sigma-70 family)